MLPLILLAAAGSAAALQVTSPVAGVQWTVGQPASINWIVRDFFSPPACTDARRCLPNPLHR